MEKQSAISRVKKLIARNQFILYLLIFCGAFFVYLWIQASPTFLDPDSFYHLKMIKLILETRGPAINFPWLQFTVLKNYYIDQHFFYHVLGVPFIQILGDFIGLKFYTVALSTVFIMLSYAILKKYRIKFAEFFIVVSLLCVPFLFRISLAKEAAFSLIFLFCGIYCIFKKKHWLLFFLSFLYVWAYGGFGLILVATLIYIFSDALFKALAGEIIEIKKMLSIFFKTLFSRENIKLLIIVSLGVILGLVVNPYFPKNLFFYWQQLVQIGLINYRGAVNVGGEWYPYSPLELLGDIGVVFMVFVLALSAFFIFFKKQGKESIFFFICSLLFLGLTLKSKRYVEYLVPFLVFFSAFSLSCAYIPLKELFIDLKKGTRSRRLLIAVLIYLSIALPLILVKDAYITRQSFEGGISFKRFSGISKFLEEKSNPGDIVMHTSWDDFPMLFYYNSKDYYIVGLDPTFMYNYNAKLYNLYADITMAKKSDHLYQEIKDNFGAKYFVVNKGRDALERNLQNDGNFIKVYEDNDGAVYKLK